MSVLCAYETYWQYSVADFGRSVSGRKLGRHRTGAVRHHYWHSAGRAGVQNGGFDVDPVRQDRGIWRRCGIGAGQYCMVRVGWRMDGDWLRIRRFAELRHHHWHSVRHSVVQDGQTGVMAVRFADSLACDQRIQRSRPSDAVRHVSIEVLRSDCAVAPAGEQNAPPCALSIDVAAGACDCG